MLNLKIGDFARFWRLVDRRTANECWEWRGARDRNGYGMFKACGVMLRASRVAFTIGVRRINSGRLIMHTCDNPPCCNPAHLIEGTFADNAADRDGKGRHRAAGGDDHYTRTRPHLAARGDRHGSVTMPHRTARGEGKGSQAKLSDKAVRDIRARVASGETQKHLADEYGVSRATVCLVVSGKRWAHVK